MYTSYFGYVKKLPDGIVPISICGKAPYWWKGLQYRKLAPRLWFFMKWKENHDDRFYVEHFRKEVLDRLDPEQVWCELERLAGGRAFALICYEKPGDFCHRHLVAEWLRAHGFDIEEYKEPTKQGDANESEQKGTGKAGAGQVQGGQRLDP